MTKSQENQNVGERRLSFDRKGAAMLRIVEESFLVVWESALPYRQWSEEKVIIYT